MDEKFGNVNINWQVIMQEDKAYDYGMSQSTYDDGVDEIISASTPPMEYNEE